MRDEDQQHTRWRFLQGFQQGIGGCGIHVLGGMDHCAAPAATMRAESKEVTDLAHLFDLDLLAGLLGDLAGFVGFFLPRLQVTIVRMIALQKPVAGVANATGAFSAGRLTKHPLRQRKRHIAFADACRAVQQQGMRQVLAVRAQLLKQRPIPRMNHARDSSTVASCRRT